MATVNKDFKIKSGLVVEGTTGTINGYDILTESQASQDFILDLIGGETLVKSVGSNLAVDAEGQLSLDLVGIVEDIAGNRLTTDGSFINVDVDGIADDLTGSYDFATNSDVTMAVGQEATNRDAAIATAKDEAGVIAQGYADTAEENANSYTNTAITNLDLSNTYDAKGSAATAEQNAKDYADDLINDASNLSTEVWSAYKTSTEIDLAQAAAELHADNAVAALIDAAPAMLDTLNELAAALGDDADFIGTVNAAIGEKVAKAGDTMTGALTLSGAPTSNLHAATKAYVDSAESNAISTAAADATTKADAAEAAAIAHADALTTDDVAEGEVNEYFTDARAKASAGDLLAGATKDNVEITYVNGILSISAENGVADSTTDDLAEGSTNKYFSDALAVSALEAVVPNFTAVELNSVAKNVAGTTTVPVAGIATAYSWAKADYRSAEFLVKVAYGDHTEISKVLLTLAANDNIAITEYGIVGTNGSASSVSAVISGNDVQLQVTTVNNTSTVTVVGTLLA